MIFLDSILNSSIMINYNTCELIYYDQKNFLIVVKFYIFILILKFFSICAFFLHFYSYIPYFLLLHIHLIHFLIRIKFDPRKQSIGPIKLFLNLYILHIYIDFFLPVDFSCISILIYSIFFYYIYIWPTSWVGSNR